MSTSDVFDLVIVAVVITALLMQFLMNRAFAREIVDLKRRFYEKHTVLVELIDSKGNGPPQRYYELLAEAKKE